MPNWNTLTNKQGLIVWGGEQSTNYGIVVSSAPVFDRPVKRANVYNVQGRNGSVLFQDGSFDDVTRTYKVWIDENEQYDSGGSLVSGDLASRIYAFSEWLYSKNGYQELTDNFEPDIFRLAYYSGGREITNELMIYGETEIQFTCRPERFLVSGKSAETHTSGDTITNPTKYTSKPLIHIEGSGTVTVTLGGNTMTAVLGTSDYIDIDCERMNAYKGTTLKNDKISGDFPVIKSGNNTLTTTGTITKLTITPRYFVL